MPMTSAIANATFIAGDLDSTHRWRGSLISRAQCSSSTVCPARLGVDSRHARSAAKAFFRRLSILPLHFYHFSLDGFVQPPFRRIPIADLFKVWLKLLFDSRPL